MGRAPDELPGCRPSTDVILSNVEIQMAVDDGRLIIDPEPAPRSRASQYSECPYQTSAVDLTLGSMISLYK